MHWFQWPNWFLENPKHQTLLIYESSQNSILFLAGGSQPLFGNLLAPIRTIADDHKTCGGAETSEAPTY